uniref:Uncharacterized protein n=1 Tax=Lepeophtheirus salmonis TaxID=72036 RepID=A0A0K2VFQ1_LEPSM
MVLGVLDLILNKIFLIREEPEHVWPEAFQQPQSLSIFSQKLGCLTPIGLAP